MTRRESVSEVIESHYSLVSRVDSSDDFTREFLSALNSNLCRGWCLTHNDTEGAGPGLGYRADQVANVGVGAVVRDRLASRSSIQSTHCAATTAVIMYIKRSEIPCVSNIVEGQSTNRVSQAL